MSKDDAKKLKDGDTVRIRANGNVFIVKEVCDCCKFVYITGYHAGHNKLTTLNHMDVRKEKPGEPI